MQIILLEDIRNLGKIGEIVNVRDGYGRNFLLKSGKALRADRENIDFVKKKKDERINLELWLLSFKYKENQNWGIDFKIPSDLAIMYPDS